MNYAFCVRWGYELVAEVQSCFDPVRGVMRRRAGITLGETRLFDIPVNTKVNDARAKDQSDWKPKTV